MSDVRAAPSPRQLFFSIFPSIMIPMFLAIVDQTIVSTALPRIASDLGNVEHVSWVVVSYLFSTTVAAPIYGYLGDTFGRRRLILVAISIFFISSLLCAIAPSVLLLSLARVAQGLGGGGLITLSQAMIGEIVPPRDRGKYQGYLATVAIASASFGPVAGGWITEHLGWRAVFLVNAPLCIVAFILALRLRGTPGSKTAGWRFDVKGLLFFLGFVLPLLLAIERADNVTSSGLLVTGALLGLSLVSAALLVLQEITHPAPLLSIALLRRAVIWRANALAACHGAALTALVTFVPLYLRVLRDASPSQTGYLLLPITAAIGVGAIVTGRLVTRTGKTMAFPSVGLAFATATLLIFAFGAPSLSTTQISALLTANALFMGTVMGVVQVTVQTAAAPSELGAAAASVQFSRSVGAAFGTALLGAILFATLRHSGSDALDLFQQLLRAEPGGPQAAQAVRDGGVLLQIEFAFRLAFIALAAFTFAGMILAIKNPMRRV